jgi:hypothetical protein
LLSERRPRGWGSGHPTSEELARWRAETNKWEEDNAQAYFAKHAANVQRLFAEARTAIELPQEDLWYMGQKHAGASLDEIAKILARTAAAVRLGRSLPPHVQRTAAEGQWLHDEFIFFEPKVALLTKWLPADNGHAKTVVVAGVPPGYLVIYEVRQDSPGYFSGVLEVHPSNQSLNLAEIKMGAGSIRYDGKPLWLVGYVRPDSTGIVVRIMLKGYQR